MTQKLRLIEVSVKRELTVQSYNFTHVIAYALHRVFDHKHYVSGISGPVEWTHSSSGATKYRC